MWGDTADEFDIRRVSFKPGEIRKFTADIPQSFDAAPDVNPEKFGGRATNVRFSK